MNATEIDQVSRTELIEAINQTLSGHPLDERDVRLVVNGGGWSHKLPVKNGIYVSLRLWRNDYRSLRVQLVVRPWPVIPLLKGMELAVLNGGQEVGRMAFSCSSGEATLTCRPLVLANAQLLLREILEAS